MNYVITAEKSQTVTVENPFAKEEKDKKVEKTFSSTVMGFNIISDKALTAAELIAQASEIADKQVRLDIAERKLYSRSFVKGEEVKKFYASSDVVEETSLRYSAVVKTSAPEAPAAPVAEAPAAPEAPVAEAPAAPEAPATE